MLPAVTTVPLTTAVATAAETGPIARGADGRAFGLALPAMPQLGWLSEMPDPGVPVAAALQDHAVTLEMPVIRRPPTASSTPWTADATMAARTVLPAITDVLLSASAHQSSGSEGDVGRGRADGHGHDDLAIALAGMPIVPVADVADMDLVVSSTRLVVSGNGTGCVLARYSDLRACVDSRDMLLEEMLEILHEDFGLPHGEDDGPSSERPAQRPRLADVPPHCRRIVRLRQLWSLLDTALFTRVALRDYIAPADDAACAGPGAPSTPASVQLVQLLEQVPAVDIEHLAATPPTAPLAALLLSLMPADTPTAIANRSGILVAVNDACCGLLGATRESIMTNYRHLYRLVAPTDVAALGLLHVAALKTEDALWVESTVRVARTARAPIRKRMRARLVRSVSDSGNCKLNNNGGSGSNTSAHSCVAWIFVRFYPCMPEQGLQCRNDIPATGPRMEPTIQ